MNPVALSTRLAAASALLILAACASAPVPTEQMAVGRKAVERASGTPDVVQWAPSELDRARSKIQQAEVALRDKRYDDARRLADDEVLVHPWYNFWKRDQPQPVKEQTQMAP